MCPESRLPRRSKFCACRKLLRSCVLNRCQWSALPDKLGKRLRFVLPKTFPRYKTISLGLFVPLNRFIRDITISHGHFVPPETFHRDITISRGHFVPLNRFVRNEILLHKTDNSNKTRIGPNRPAPALFQKAVMITTNPSLTHQTGVCI